MKLGESEIPYHTIGDFTKPSRGELFGLELIIDVEITDQVRKAHPLESAEDTQRSVEVRDTLLYGENSDHADPNMTALL